MYILIKKEDHDMKKMMKCLSDKRDLVLWSVIVCIGFVYFFLLGERGYYMTPDSNSYIFQSYEREPFYPVVIQLCKMICGERYFLYAVVLLQAITAFGACLFAARKLQRYMRLNRMELLMCFLLLLFPFGLDSMWSQPRVNFAHMIMTDCFSYAFFYFFTGEMLSYLQDGKKSAYLWMAAIVSVMVINRNQMAILYVNIAFLTVVLNCFWSKKKEWGRCLRELALIVTAFILTMVLTLGYCYVKWGYFSKSSENSFTFVTNLLYAADAEDAELFEDEEAGAVFTQLYDQIDEAGWTYRYAGEGALAASDYMIACHDPIKSRILRPFFQDYVSQLGMEPMSFESDRIKKAVMEEIKQVLLKEHFGDWLFHALGMMPRGLIYSVIPVIVPGTYPAAAAAALAVWIAFFAGLVYLLLSKKTAGQARVLPVFAVSIAGFMIMNVAALSLVIFVMYRYLNYTQGLFWIVFYLIFREIYRDRIRGKKDYILSHTKG